ncbi:TetR family transcriptional regulator [Gordonia desulfuricans]|uniref:TetR family transcriptional regulator n=1 Tax=Gordonia desulfuricans TaxID=89051 RepID=A0A7K3LP25_9ACTN|nr:TetR family transcriptional regulator [Gordonia desulfuricans]NDK89992.1 TetR family transcriptional regulator [Gordonia desulfuricans]
MAELPTSPTTRPTAGDRIRAARLSTGISLREFARRLGLSPATLSAMENGQTGITVDRFETIAGELGIEPSALFDGTHATAPTRPDPAPALPPTASTGGRWRVYEGPEVTDPVLAAALRCIVERGYHGCTIRDIAAAAGMSVSALYHHYPSKQAMLVTLFDHTMDELLDRVTAARADGSDDPAQELALMVESLALYHCCRPGLAFCGHAEMRGLAEPDHRRVADRRVALQRQFDAVVEHGCTSRRFATPRPREAARAVVGLCMSVSEWFDPAGPDTPHEVAALYTDYALGLVGCHPLRP